MIKGEVCILEAAYRHIWKNNVSTAQSSRTLVNVEGIRSV